MSQENVLTQAVQMPPDVGDRPILRLVNWSTCYAEDNPFRAPELRRKALQGRPAEGGEPRRTAALANKLGPRLFELTDGSVCELFGDPDPGFVDFCRDKLRKPLNVEDPVSWRTPASTVAGATHATK